MFSLLFAMLLGCPSVSPNVETVQANQSAPTVSETVATDSASQSDATEVADQTADPLGVSTDAATAIVVTAPATTVAPQ